MKNNTNIYDIDGKLIRAAGDNHSFTLEEAQEKLEYYREKLSNLDENDKKAAIYATYMRNLSGYIAQLYMRMPADKFEQLMSKYNNDKALNNEINKAIEELKSEVYGSETAENTNDEVQGTVTGDTESSTDGESGDVEVIERGFSDIHEERPRTQSDFLVERDNVNTVMDEYVSPIGEASDEYVQYEEV